MRDLGYTLDSALADLVDNAIAAGAETIRIFADTTTNSAKIGILDDGRGMTADELQKAMRLGSRSPLETRGLKDLGRFGLGLKTASFSQCRVLTVASRKGGSTQVARWNLNEITDDWLLQLPDGVESVPWAEQLPDTGTLVVWESLDRLIDRTAAGSQVASLVRRIDEARTHLELVFHRYLAGEPGLRKVQILLNERPLEPFDPFHSSHPATVRGPEEVLKVGEHLVRLQTYTLPHHQKVSAADWDRYGTGGGYVRNQGFYIYREKRLIIHGTWFGLARQTELTKLTRVRVDVPNGLDSQWKIDVKKQSAHPPFQVRDRLSRIIETIGSGSRRVYTYRGRTLASDVRLPVWNRVRLREEISYRLNPEHPVVVDFVSRLSGELAGDFARITELISTALPIDTIYADLGGEPENVANTEASDATLTHALGLTYRQLIAGGIERDRVMEMLRVTEPFRSNWVRAEEILTTIADGATKHV